jgi:hypothetical protein
VDFVPWAGVSNTEPAPRRVLARVSVVFTTILWPLVSTAGGAVATPPPSTCAGRSAAGLDHLFQGEVGRVVGGDYVRAFALPNRNTLIVMQDVFLAPRRSSRPVTNLSNAAFVHNAAVLLDGDGCVRRTLTGPRSYIGSDLTLPLKRWFWALGGAIGRDGLLHVMVAEMRNPDGTGAAIGAAPVGTWQATIDTETLSIQSFAPAVDSSAALYGWAVTSDRNFTYLYSHCYRQFIAGQMLGHDASCAADVRVARVPLGSFDATPEYFTGSTWRADASVAASLVFPGQRTINPVSIQYLGGTFVSVAKEGDWWGTTIYVDIAPSAVGPWTHAAVVVPTPKCAACNTYFASVMPWRESNGALVIALSNNAWEMRRDAYPNPALYRSSFIAVAMPHKPLFM